MVAAKWFPWKIHYLLILVDQYPARMPRTRRPVDLHLTLDEGSGSLASRVADAIIAALRRGALRPGDLLPSTRALALSLGLSRGPVVAAFDELAAAGFIATRAGSGAVVTPGADIAARAGARSHVVERRPPPPPMTPTSPTARVRWDLRPGRPDTTLIDPTAWRRAWRRAGAVAPGNDADQAPAHDDLRRALAGHLRRSRGLLAEPDEILIVPGVAAFLHALVAAVPGPWALEDPGYAEARSALDLAGADSVPVPVDDEGLDPADLAAATRAVYVTPAHQYPLGARMPVSRRAALLDWAIRTGGLIVEDDYDGEFRYDVAPMPALRSWTGAGRHVIYVGTASKLWSPTLRVAWVIAPEHVRDHLALALERRALHVPEATGHVLAHLLTSGAWSTHHARCARTYAARRAALVAALGERLPGHALAGTDAGLHLVIRLPDEVDDRAVVTRLAEAGLLLNPLTAYAVDRPVSGLVLCYATLPETQARPAAAALASVLRS